MASTREGKVRGAPVYAVKYLSLDIAMFREAAKERNSLLPHMLRALRDF